MIGARVFEKHVTLNRAWKGTDHSFHIREGFRKFVRDIRRVSYMLPEKPKMISERVCLSKTWKIHLLSKDLKKGDVIARMICLGRFLMKYIPVRNQTTLLKKVSRFAAGEIIKHEDLED